MIPDQGPLVVGVCNKLSPDMEMLRVSGFRQTVSPRDEFDGQRYNPVYLWIRRSGVLIALFRMTFPGPAQKSLIDTWTGKHLSNVPRGKRVAEISRGVVAPSWRQHGVYRLVVSSMLRVAMTRDVSHINVILAEDCPARGLFARYGFQELSDPLPVNIQGEQLNVVPASLHLAGSHQSVLSAHSAAVEKLTSSCILMQPDPSLPRRILGWTGAGHCRADHCLADHCQTEV